jgi:hypothetical protein
VAAWGRWRRKRRPINPSFATAPLNFFFCINSIPVPIFFFFLARSRIFLRSVSRGGSGNVLRIAHTNGEVGFFKTMRAKWRGEGWNSSPPLPSNPFEAIKVG